MKSQQQRPSSAIFADGSKAIPLAIHPQAIGVTYDTRESDRVATIKDGVAVLCVDGPLEHKGGDGWWCYWQTYEDLARDFKGLCDDGSVRAIVLKFDSPGGECAGLNETVKIMQGMKAASGKPVIGYVDEACYSAAYALAMVCDEIYLPESAGVGSIGVITAMADCTEADKKAGYRVEVIASGAKKTDGHPHVALTDGAIKRTQKMVDKLAASFFEIVAEGRGIDAKVIEGFQAGIFTGQAAVDVGLADGVMSLKDCLLFATSEFSSHKVPTDRSGEEESPPMSGTLAAAKALADANKALAAAKTDSDRALAAARVLAAEDVAAKVKKTKTVTTDTHEEEVDDGEPEDDDDDEMSMPESTGADGDYDKDAAASADNAKTGLYTKDRLLRLARQITGKKSIDEVMGALQAMHHSHKKNSKLAAQVAQLEADVQSSKMSSLISQGMKAGKLAPSQKAWAKTMTPAGLKAYLDAAPKVVHTDGEEHTEARVEGAGLGSVTAEMAKIWHKQGFAEGDYPALLAKMNGHKATNGAS